MAKSALWIGVGLLSTLAQVAVAEVFLEAPDRVAAGASFEVHWAGETDPADFVTLVLNDEPEGKYGTYKYARSTSATFLAPDDPGTYEIRYLSRESGYPTLARRTLEVTPVTATLSGPTTIEAGGTIELDWTGPDNPRDFITVVEAGAEERTYGTYVYARRGSPARVVVPEAMGAYEARYLTGQRYYTLARHAFEVTSVSALVEGPSTVTEGSTFTVSFEGTGNPRDFVTIVPAGAPEKKYGDYSYVRDDTSVELVAPEEPGDYELRYLTARGYATLASQPITVGSASASLDAPAEVQGGEHFLVEWSGIGNPSDYITVVEPSAEPQEYGPYAYVRRGNPVRIRAPLEPGDYELRYAMGSSRKILARRPIRVTEPASRPGELRIVHSVGGGQLGLPEGAAVELILDASGSMLQRLGGERRIDIAKAVLGNLVEQSLPPATPFALRVFGHREADSCRTDLEIALSPLDPGAASARIGGIEAKNLAKTPIATSLENVAQDLAGTDGMALVVLVTDGEETCGGDPAAAVEKLRSLGFEVRVDIVGFAIHDDTLEAQFQFWAELGGGNYHPATTAADLAESIRSSLRAAFTVLDGSGQEVATGTVDGPPLDLPAGDYRVRVEGRSAEIPVTVVADERKVVDLASI